MSVTQVFAWLSLGLPVPAAAAVTGWAVDRKSAALSLLYGTIVYASLLVVPLHAEAALELVGLIDRITLSGPAVASGAVLLVAWLSGAGRRSESLRVVPTRIGSNILQIPGDVLTAIGLVALVYTFFGLERLVGYPVSWDGVSYHLPVAATWLREGSLGIGPEAHFYEAVTWNGDLLAMLAMATGWVSLGELWNLVSVTMLLSASYLLSRVIGVARRAAILTALLVAALPIVLFQTFSAYVDLLVTAGVIGGLAMVGLLYTEEVADEARAPVLWGAGLALGLALGAKPTAWTTGFVVVAAALAWLFFRGPAFGAGRGKLLGGFVAAVAAPVIFWLARNGLATSNPFFPLDVPFVGHWGVAGTPSLQVSFGTDGIRFVEYVRDWLVVPWTDRVASGYPYSPGSGLGPLFAVFGLPGLFYLFWILGRSGPSPGAQPERWRLRGALVGFLVIVWIVWWFAHREVWRFGLAGLVTVCVLSGPFLEDFTSKLPRLFGSVLLAAVFAFGAIAITPRAQSLAHQIRHGEWGWEEYYHLPADYLRLPRDATVVNADVTLEGWNNFALLGPQLTRRVVPDWKVKTALQRERWSWPCGSYVVDRAPFRLASGSDEVRRSDLRLVAETVAHHGDTGWRIWLVEGEGCSFP